MRWSGIEPEFKRWQRLVITATLPAQTGALRHPLYTSIHINSFSNGFLSHRKLFIIYLQSNIRGGIMDYNKMVGYILYAIGIIGGVEGATNVRPGLGSIISIISIIVIIIASYMLAKKQGN